MTTRTVECKLAIRRRTRDTNCMPPCTRGADRASGRVPRVARLMALALRFEELVRSGAVGDYAELARLGQVSRARITQIMNLLHLAPDIQEQILFLPQIQKGRDRIHLESLQRLVAILDWQVQRRGWHEMLASASQ